MEALVEKLCHRFSGVTGMQSEHCFDLSPRIYVLDKPCFLCFSKIRRLSRLS